VLSREFAEFLIEFSIALNRHTMYPDGHPALGPARQRVHGRLFRLLEGRPVLSLGVAQQQLIIEGVATDPKNPVLRDLATRLHDHSLGAVEFERGVESHELHTLFQLLMADPERQEGPFIQDLTKKLKSSRHVTLYPVRYENLELVGDGVAPDSDDDSIARTRAAQLWLGLAQGALDIEASEKADAEQPDSEMLNDPAAVAEAISGHPESTAYDQVIVGYMLQIAEELRGGDSHDTAVLRKRMSALVEGLDEDTLGRLLTMGDDRSQRRKFMRQAVDGMEVDAVIDLVTAATNMEGEGVSRIMLRMLKKQAQQARSANPKRRLFADTSVREQVRELIEGWSLEDPTPGAYANALNRMTSATAFVEVSPEARHLPEPDRLFQMALEVDEIGDGVIAAVDGMLELGQAVWILRGLHAADAPTVVSAVREHLSKPETVTQLLQRESIDVEAMKLLVEQVGMATVEPMLSVLKETEDQQKRRALIDLLVLVGPDVGPSVVVALSDERWQVKRNMLLILGQLERLPEGFDPADHKEHPHPKVRFEAVKLMLRDPEQRADGIRAALMDSEEALIRLGLQTALESCPENAAPLIATKLRPSYPEGLRIMAIRALGASGSHTAVRALLKIAAPRKRFFRWRTPRKSREYVASLGALQPFRDHVQVAQALAVAARSRDVEIARAAKG
jgi:hypothetical protein